MTSDAVIGYTQLSEAAPGYEEAHAYYDGSVAEVFGSKVMQRVLRRQGKPFKVNVIQSVVDSLADRLELMSVSVPGDDTASKALQLIVDANSIDFEASNVHHRACEYGDAYLYVWEGQDEGDEPIINYRSPLGMRIIYDTDNPRRKLFAVDAWEVRSPLGQNANYWRANLLYPDRLEFLRTRPGMKPTDDEGWEPHLETDDDGVPLPDSWTVENPYGEVPVFHFRNQTPYGVPRHYNGYGSQDAVNKLVISHMSTIDFHIAPQRYALALPGAGEADDALDDDDDPGFGDEEGQGHDSGQGLESGPGVIQMFKGVKEVGQFDPAKSEAFTGPLTMYLGLMAQTCKTPLHMVDNSGDEPSGESRRRKEAPLTKAVRDYSKMFATTWADALAFALKVANYPEREVKVTFAPAEVVADSEGWATIKAKVEAGVPVRVALLEAGYSEEQVETWFPDGEENQLRVVDLEAVSRILQQLGAAVALDIISAEEARALLPEGVLPEGAAAPPPSPLPVPPTS